MSLPFHVHDHNVLEYLAGPPLPSGVDVNEKQSYSVSWHDELGNLQVFTSAYADPLDMLKAMRRGVQLLYDQVRKPKLQLLEKASGTGADATAARLELLAQEPPFSFEEFRATYAVMIQQLLEVFQRDPVFQRQVDEQARKLVDREAAALKEMIMSRDQKPVKFRYLHVAANGDRYDPVTCCYQRTCLECHQPFLLRKLEVLARQDTGRCLHCIHRARTQARIQAHLADDEAPAPRFNRWAAVECLLCREQFRVRAHRLERPDFEMVCSACAKEPIYRGQTGHTLKRYTLQQCSEEGCRTIIGDQFDRDVNEKTFCHIHGKLRESPPIQPDEAQVNTEVAADWVKAPPSQTLPGFLKEITSPPAEPEERKINFKEFL